MHFLLFSIITITTVACLSIWLTQKWTRKKVAKHFIKRADALMEAYPYRAKTYFDAAVELVGKEHAGEMFDEKDHLNRQLLRRLVKDSEAYFARGNFRESLKLSTEANEVAFNVVNCDAASQIAHDKAQAMVFFEEGKALAKRDDPLSALAKLSQALQLAECARYEIPGLEECRANDLTQLNQKFPRELLFLLPDQEDFIS